MPAGPKTCHFVLEYKWYDKIDKGEKRVEYRDNTPYWRRRIIGAFFATFHRGYTSTTMTFRIRKKIIGQKIEVHLGERCGVA